ncbi:MAG: DUF4340 domain-containing protein [Clostridia bacterium]|nr:DUF4340 domain-containing protein [Clostridia bacterium]
MNVRKIIFHAVIGIVIIALLVALINFLNVPSEEEEIEADDNIAVFTADKDTLQSITISTEDETYTIYRSDEAWLMEGLEGVSVQESLVNTLANSLSAVTAAMLVVQNSNDEDLYAYGLDYPSCTVSLTYDDLSETFYVGSRSGDYYYFRLASSNDVYFVPYNKLYLLQNGRASFLDKTVWSIDEDDVTSFSFSGITIERDGDDWRETKPYNIIADSTDVESVLGTLATISGSDVYSKDEITFKATEKITVVTSDGETHTMSLQEMDDDTYLASNNTSDYICRVPASSLTFLDSTGFDLISPYVAPISITEITSIEFIAPDKTVTLSIEAPSSEAPIFYKDGVEADETNFRDFYLALMELTFDEEGEGSGSAERTIIFTKENGDVQKVEFIPVSESTYAVRINGSGNFLIKKKDVTDIFGYLDNIQTVG